MTVGGQSFAKAFDAVAVQMRNGVAPANVAPQPFFETALGGAGSSYCGAQSCTATVAQNYTGNFIYPQISSMWDSLDSHWTFGPMLPQTKQVGMLYTMTSLGYSNYNAMYVQLRKAMAHGLTLNSNFTYGHSNDTAGITQDQNDTGSNAFHPEYDYGPSLFDHKFAFNLLGVYDLPFGRGHKLSGGSGSLGRGALNKIISGWSVAPVYSQESGAPTAVTPGMDPGVRVPGTAEETWSLPGTKKPPRSIGIKRGLTVGALLAPKARLTMGTGRTLSRIRKKLPPDSARSLSAKTEGRTAPLQMPVTAAGISVRSPLGILI